MKKVLVQIFQINVLVRKRIPKMSRIFNLHNQWLWCFQIFLFDFQLFIISILCPIKELKQIVYLVKFTNHDLSSVKQGKISVKDNHYYNFG